MKTKLTKSQKDKVQTAIENHERFRNSYVWNSPGAASARRSYERKNSFAVQFVNAGVRYSYTSDVSCSCKNIYYTGTFMVDGEKKTVRVFKNLLK